MNALGFIRGWIGWLAGFGLGWAVLVALGLAVIAAVSG